MPKGFALKNKSLLSLVAWGYHPLMPALPLVHDVGDNGGEEAQQHDCGACIHHRVQELPWVLGQGEDSLQILKRKQRRPRLTI